MATGTPPVRSSETYSLPHEDREYDRLDIQHAANKATFGGLYPLPCREKVLEVLSPSPGQTRRVLDLGSGSGAWCVDIALEFPHAEVLGIDLEPRQIREPPSNCTFRRHNIDQGLSEYHGMYDFVHCRFSGHGVGVSCLNPSALMLLQFRDHKAAMMEAVRCLKPRGLVLLLDTGGIVTEDRSTMYKAATSANPEWSWLQRMFKMVMCGSKRWNTDDTKAKRDVGEGFWDLEGCDPNKCGGLEAFVPLGDWASSGHPLEIARSKRMSYLWIECISKVHRHLDKPLKASGRTDKGLEILLKRIDQDWLEKRHRMVFLIRAIWAQTPAKENKSAEPRIMPLNAPEVDAGASVPYPLVVYYDKDEWRNRNEALWDSYTPEMKLMMTVEGYDMIEDLDMISVRNS